MNLFSVSANSVYWLAIGAGATAIIAVPSLSILWARTPYATGQNTLIEQPVKFDHRHHVHDAAIDCTYCHDGAKRTRVAGVPATSLCMGCHSQIWKDSPELAPVRESARTNTPIRWQRVNNVPDFVFFDHRAHTSRGVACEKCHGDVGSMAQVYAVQNLTMDFCIDCHRENAAPVHCSECHR